ncbi:1-acyl-sn-glycerol-3-phosphate acyltransferase [Actibacterium sp. 188UL27-1]|uniref:lysophospholipid acyltransferase family protein n=1 Tax=Actibacterium sp. 188UL27-1 TaxID=2786961 RepID=UPI00195BEE24|nr:lysophospholipid acyltransferase family protein [Actibacterium sp. 188UL27-1]MBM7066329.1 1-acyl-sn-glycerol-3-phosphate acyltransferase [Actibacterium sp. 188UL27-1]
MTVLQGTRSVLFLTQMYLMMPIMGIVFLPYMLLTPDGARFACKTYARWTIWTARWMVGIRTEIRGTVPADEVLVVAKHQSFFDIIVIFEALPSSRFIMKRQLLYTPVIGQYARRLGCIPVDRGKKGAAIKKMVQDVAAERREPGQLVIYPQGTRVAPGARVPYKVGAGALYDALQQTCYPVATNAGLFWPRTGLRRSPGLAVVEFLPPIPAGLPVPDFMERLEHEVETASDRLMADAGFSTQREMA